MLPSGGRGPTYDSSAPLSPLNKVLFPDIELPLYDPAQPRTFDLVVVGSGPSGLAVAHRVAEAGFKVTVRPRWWCRLSAGGGAATITAAAAAAPVQLACCHTTHCLLMSLP